MIHTAKSGFLGNVHDARIELEVLENANKTLLQYLSEFSGLSDADLIDLTQRDKWMSPEEAKNLGFVDNII
jgi:ATP-dependent Clp protease protease subunit